MGKETGYNKLHAMQNITYLKYMYQYAKVNDTWNLTDYNLKYFVYYRRKVCLATHLSELNKQKLPFDILACSILNTVRIWAAVKPRRNKV